MRPVTVLASCSFLILSLTLYADVCAPDPTFVFSDQRDLVGLKKAKDPVVHIHLHLHGCAHQWCSDKQLLRRLSQLSDERCCPSE